MASSVLHVRLLGGLDLQLDGQALGPLESARAESLLAWLLLHRDAPQTRQHLAYLLWPDSSEAQARTNLRHLLHTLRRALPELDPYLIVTPRTLQWGADAPYWLDVTAFDAAIARASQGGPEGRAALREAVALYGGDLLPGCYDEWIVEERERLRQRIADALARLASLLEEDRDYHAAIAHAERLLRLDPLNEETYRLLMRLHDARGNRAGAVRVYHACAATLERELGIAPDAETREAYERLMPAASDGPGADHHFGPAADAPLVGRAAEWARLTTRWREAEEGRAQLILISGEPGIGKSRLAEDLRAWAAQRGAATAVAHSYAAEGALAFGPLVTWLRSDAIGARIARLPPAQLSEIARLLPEVRADAPPVPETISESEQRLRMFDAAVRVILAVGRPLLLVADDLQWCDQPTLQFLHYLLRSAPQARLLVAATVRREELDHQHPLHDLLASLRRLDRAEEIALSRLTPGETALLATSVAGNALAAADAERLYAETEGNPLFIVEALRAGWRATDQAASISPKVQAVIESRLAQVSDTARELVGVAATIGRAFSPATLAHASQCPEDVLVQGLDELWRRRIVRDHGDDAYDFSHDKIREVAYLALSPAQRRRHHAAVADALAQVHASDLDAVSHQIAAHWERAARPEEAIDWYRRAAAAAQARSANEEATRLLDHALDLLRALPDSAARAEHEVAILAAQTPILGWMEGYASPRLAAVYQRALALAAAHGVELPAPLQRSLAVTSLTQGDFATARRFGTELWRRGEREDDDVLRVESGYVLGIAAFWQGDLPEARRHFQTAVDRYQPAARRAHLLQYGLDPKAICLSRLSNTLWLLGFPEEAVRARAAALALSEEIGHPFTLATALVFAALLALEMGDLATVRAHAAALRSTRPDLLTKPTRNSAEAMAGYLDVVDGRTAPGLARIEQALVETRQAEHAPGIHAANLRLLLAALAASGDAEAGLAAAEEMIGLTAVHLWEAEARRFRAECLVALGSPDHEVEAEFARALAVARRQGARALEGRAASSLLHFRRQTGDELSIREADDALQALLATMPAASGIAAANAAPLGTR